MNFPEIIKDQINHLKNELNPLEFASGEIIFINGRCQILSQSSQIFELIVEIDDNKSEEYSLRIDEDGLMQPLIGKSFTEWDKYSFACLLQIENEIHLLDPKANVEHKKYTREGMIKRVLNERKFKAKKAEYRIKWSDNIYGDHILTNEKGVKYKVFLRDFENEIGYSDSLDAEFNQLGTTKHIMYAFKQLKDNKSLYRRLKKSFPFVEIYTDPLNDYKISWYFPSELPIEEQLLILRYFKSSSFIENDKLELFLGFIKEADKSNLIKIRPEVHKKLENHFEKKMLNQLARTSEVDFKMINANLFGYQKEGIEFTLFKKAAIIADEMGLGKTIQAIGSALLKKEIFDFKKTLIICPASLKEQWKNEIEKFSNEKAIIIQGKPSERVEQYKNEDYFFIANYETVVRDQIEINKLDFDFVVLDEAQRVKNYETKTASSLKKIKSKHKLVITGTPIENKLIDIYSIINVIDPYYFGPLWEFSYQHCLFDPEKINKINGYYNLQNLKNRLSDILIRREKRKVLDQLPNIQQIDIPVELSPLQSDYHNSYARGLAKIVRKKFLTPFDLQKMQMLMTSMRMVCDSSYLINQETNESPKLEELKHILFENIDIKNSDRKIIIFSEWIKVHKLIGKILRENNVGFVELNGSVPVKSRGDLIRKFENNKQYKIFLSTEAGGSGLNLQAADILINFELPWNPAKKNQRIGRIDRLGQKSNKLTVFNLITRNSIEQQIASGLLVKQSLFDGVLGGDTNQDFVDFTTKGRSQFIEQIEDLLSGIEKNDLNDEFEREKNVSEIEKENLTEKDKNLLDLSGDNLETEENLTLKNKKENKESRESTAKLEEMKEVMSHGMSFLAGMYKMSTGKEIGIENQKVEVNQETGELVMKFKIPK
ncbi:MAG: DEAD/DEAH box helicase [Flavobacteriaceae bacterium]|nr:DEAD/DEAH box helicase [Flavobacteriaceae bacterium]